MSSSTTVVHPDDMGYNSCEDMNNGLWRYKKSNLATWLCLRLP